MKIKQSNVVLASTVALALTVSVGCIWPFGGGEASQSTANQNQNETEEEQMDQQKDTNMADSEEGQEGEEEKEGMTKPEVLYRVNAGATSTFESDGNTWESDKLVWKGDEEWGAEGGKTVNRGGIEIRNTNRDDIYRTERWGMPGYKFKVPNGNYNVRLHFSEGYHAVGSAGTRIFTVEIEDKDVLSDFDVYKEAGFSRRTAVVRTIENIPVKDGELNINFQFQKLTPLINGIEVIQVP